MKLEIRNLTKSYKNTLALDQLNLSLHEGMNGFLGPNGAGKTTLMKIMATVLQPTQGTVFYDGYDVTKHLGDIRRLIGYLPQTYGLYDNVSVEDFLQYVGVLKCLPRDKIKSEVQRVVEICNLTDKRLSKIKTLSGGMRQRVGIAQAFLGDPQVIIADEPTAGLDPEERTRFRNILTELSVGKIVILSTHIVSDVENSCNKLCVLGAGQLLYCGDLAGLTACSRGRVWELEVASELYKDVENKYKVLNIRRNKESLTISILNSNEVCGAAEVQPSLELGYHCLLADAN